MNEETLNAIKERQKNKTKPATKKATAEPLDLNMSMTELADPELGEMEDKETEMPTLMVDGEQLTGKEIVAYVDENREQLLAE